PKASAMIPRTSDTSVLRLASKVRAPSVKWKFGGCRWKSIIPSATRHALDGATSKSPILIVEDPALGVSSKSALMMPEAFSPICVESSLGRRSVSGEGATHIGDIDYMIGCGVRELVSL